LFMREKLDLYTREALDPVIQSTLEQCERGTDGMVRADLVPLTRNLLHRLAACVTGIDDVDTPDRTDLFVRYVTTMAEAQTVEWSTGDQDAIIRHGEEVRRKFVRDFFERS